MAKLTLKGFMAWDAATYRRRGHSAPVTADEAYHARFYLSREETEECIEWLAEKKQNARPW